MAHLIPPARAPAGRGAHLANRAAARSGTRHACVPVGSPLPTHSARGRAARVGAGPRVPRGCRNGGYGRSAPMAARGSRRSVRGSRTRPCVPSQHWRGTVMGSAAPRRPRSRHRIDKASSRFTTTRGSNHRHISHSWSPASTELWRRLSFDVAHRSSRRGHSSRSSRSSPSITAPGWSFSMRRVTSKPSTANGRRRVSP